MVRSGKKEKWILYTLVVLLCLVLASFWLMCNIYARYSTQTSGSDGARVAKFDVTENAQNFSQQIEATFYPGFEQTYTVSVTNHSEVAIEYVMNVKNKYGNLPLKFQMFQVLDENDKEITSDSTDVATQDYDLSKSAEISATDHDEHVYKLKISWPKNAEAGEAEPQDPDFAGKVDVIDITLKAVQKD